MFDELEERPRERLYTDGADKVSDAELISLVLGTGSRSLPVDQAAEGVLRAMGGLGPLARASPRELVGVSGLGEAKAARLVAAFQLGRRALERARARTPILDDPEAVFRRLRPRFVGLTQEVFLVVALNGRGMVLEELEVARGTLCRVDVHPRDVFRPLVRIAAGAAILVHNHPSGDAAPSREDLMLTDRMCMAGDLLGIPIMDHVIVTDDTYASVNDYLEDDDDLDDDLDDDPHT